MKLHATESRIVRAWMVALAAAGLLALAGCATSPYGSNPQPVYGTTYGNNATPACQQCGVVESVRTVYVNGKDSNHVLGTIIGAVVGAAAGNQVGGGSGKTLATVGGAVAGGAVGHHVAEARNTAYQVVVRLDDGRVATVTQRGNPDVRPGDRVQIRNNEVHLLR